MEVGLWGIRDAAEVRVRLTRGSEVFERPRGTDAYEVEAWVMMMEDSANWLVLGWGLSIINMNRTERLC